MQSQTRALQFWCTKINRSGVHSVVAIFFCSVPKLSFLSGCVENVKRAFDFVFSKALLLLLMNENKPVFIPWAAGAVKSSLQAVHTILPFVSPLFICKLQNERKGGGERKGSLRITTAWLTGWKSPWISSGPLIFTQIVWSLKITHSSKHYFRLLKTFKDDWIALGSFTSPCRQYQKCNLIFHRFCNLL